MDRNQEKTQFEGLSSKEAAMLLVKFGENTIATRKRFRPLISFFEKFG